MNTKISLFKIRQTAYRFIEIGIYPIITIIFLLLLFWQIYSIVEAHDQLKQEMISKNALNDKLEKYRENAKISEQDRLVYGTIIKKQIPLVNNTFDIYALMESFYEITGVELKISKPGAAGNASDNSPSSASEGGTVQLNASTVLTPQSLDEIIETYQYQFSRFMTLNTIKVAKSKEGQGQFRDVDFVFQVYSLNEDDKGKNNSTGSLTQFTSEDKKNLDNYISNTNIDLYYAAQTTTPVDEEYEPSGTLF